MKDCLWIPLSSLDALIVHSFQHLDAAFTTDTGRLRKTNEDAALIALEHGLFAVADGMGGGSCGEVASRCIIQALQSYRPSQDSPEQDIQQVKEAIQKANAHIYHMANEKNLSGMGSTLVLILFHAIQPNRATLLHAGDSRAYRLRGRKWTQLMTDHSVAAENHIPRRKILPYLRNMITRAVGIAETVTLEQTKLVIEPHDLFLLCSDGLYNMISPWRLRRFMRQNRDCHAHDLSRQLVEAANERGGKDNITSLLIRVGTPEMDEDEPTADTVNVSGCAN